MPAEGLILLGHGARDPRWAEPMQRMRGRVADALPHVAVELAFLEIMSPSPAFAAERLVEAGARRIVVVPVFLGQGGHTKEDLPKLVAKAREQHPAVEISLDAPIGEQPSVIEAIAAAIAK